MPARRQRKRQEKNKPQNHKSANDEKNKPQDTSNHPIQLTTTLKCELLRHAETGGNTRHESQDPVPPPIFVSGITNMQRLSATIEQVINRLNYTLKRIYSDSIKLTGLPQNNKRHIKREKFEFYTYQPRQQCVYGVVNRNLHHSVQQELVREEI
jgi:hypothetical protein